MALGRGWWVSEATGEEREVYRHVSDIVEHPEVFGMTGEGVHRLSGVESNGPLDATVISDDSDVSKRLRTAAIMLGWIRVRFHRQSRSIELYRFDERTQNALAGFLERIGAHSVEVINVNEFATGRARPMTVAQIMGRGAEDEASEQTSPRAPAGPRRAETPRVGTDRVELSLRRLEERWGEHEFALIASPTGAERQFWFDVHWPVSPFGVVTLSCVGREYTTAAVIVPNRLLHNLPDIVAGNPVPHFRREVERWMPSLRAAEFVFHVPRFVTMRLRMTGPDDPNSRPSVVRQRSESFAALTAAYLREAHAANCQGDELLYVKYSNPPSGWMEGMARSGWDLSASEGLCEKEAWMDDRLAEFQAYEADRDRSNGQGVD
jgi:hypothetical protein